MFYLIQNLKEKPGNIIIHIGTNDALYKNENALNEELKKNKNLIITHHPNCKNICISCPIARTDNKKANNVLKNISIYQKEKKRTFFSTITFLKLIYIGMVFVLIVTDYYVSRNFISRIWCLWCNVDSNGEGLPIGNNTTMASNFGPLI